ncbi:hypothetical protein GS682_23235 [Nostoc sp. B(2019)]|nr:hypothetical protein [Nostoc sp. B(2019)]
MDLRSGIYDAGLYAMNPLLVVSQDLTRYMCNRIEQVFGDRLTFKTVVTIILNPSVLN